MVTEGENMPRKKLADKPVKKIVQANNKTKPTSANVREFLGTVEPSRRREDSMVLLDLFSRATEMEPVLWGANIVGYGQYFYKYASGRSGDFPLTGFSPRKAAMSIYIMPGFKLYADQLANLGKHKHSVSCLYITRLDQVDMFVLEELVAASVSKMKEIYPVWKDFPDMAH